MQIVPIILLLVSVTTAAPTTDFGVLHRLQKRASVCYAADLARQKFVGSHECLAAMNNMMYTRPMPGTLSSPFAAMAMDVVGSFSNGAPEGSPFKLPRVAMAGRCTVAVTMVSALPHHSESASWNQIYRNTVDLIRECVARPASLGRGGVTKAGRADGILIEVYPPGFGSLPAPGYVYWPH